MLWHVTSHDVCTTSEFKILIFLALLVPRNEAVVNSSGDIVLNSGKDNKINLKSNHIKNTLQTLTFTAITSVCSTLHCWDLAPWIGTSLKV